MPHKTNLCSFSPVMRNTGMKTKSPVSPCLRGLVSVCLGFIEKLSLWCHWKQQLTVNLVMPFLRQSKSAVSFILELLLGTCLVNAVFAIDYGKRGTVISSFSSHPYMCSYVLYNCLSYKLIKEMMARNFKMKDDLKKKEKNHH